ncbi:MAG TPA: hypothetical protein VI451_22705 [Anaerolineales bacterium]|nr:hypothetical protein [Anaerolineales bacterium]
MTFPPPNYLPIPSAVPGIELYAPAPEQEIHLFEVDFQCPQCGAATGYSVADGGLKCSHCGYYEPPKKERIGKGAQEFEFKVETLEQSAARGWGEARQELECQNCGAHTTLPVGTLTATCPFCASNKVLQRGARQDALRPRFLIPFQRKPEELRPIVQNWLGSSWMTPSALKRKANLQSKVDAGQFTPIYLPYWTFDSTAQARWRAEVGYNETERYYDAGSKEWRTRTKIRWRWEDGNVSKFFDDLLVQGTGKVSERHLGKIGNFNTGGLVEYAPEYLAGMHAQAYDVQLETAWADARDRMREATRDACNDQIRGDHVRNFTMNLDFSEESWRYVLLPVYVSAFQYNDGRGDLKGREGVNTYQMLINGQTGWISGQRPVDWTKVWLAIAALLTPGVILGLIGVITLLFGGVGVVIGGIGFVLLLIGGAISFFIWRQADEMDDV